MTILELLKEINEKPLQFPKDIKLSDSVKDLLCKMLSFADKRISFEELYNHS